MSNLQLSSSVEIKRMNLDGILRMNFGKIRPDKYRRVDNKCCSYFLLRLICVPRREFWRELNKEGPRDDAISTNTGSSKMEQSFHEVLRALRKRCSNGRNGVPRFLWCYCTPLRLLQRKFLQRTTSLCHISL